MTPSPTPAAAPEIWTTTNSLSVLALIISAFALLAAGVSAWVSIQNRRDRRAVSLTLAPKLVNTGSVNDLVLSRLDWVLHNGGETAVSNPTVVVQPKDGGVPLYFEGTGSIAGGGSLDLIPIAHAPTEMPLWYSAAIHANVTISGRSRRVRVAFRIHY